MREGQSIWFKFEGQLKEGIVIKIGYEDLEICDKENNRFSRKFWEVRKIENENNNLP